MRRSLTVAAVTVAGIGVTGTAFAAWDASGTGTGTATATSVQAPSASAAPTSSTTSTSITVNWTAPISGPAPTSYRVDRVSPAATVCSVPAATTSCADSGLSPHTQYQYKVYSLLSSWISSAATASTSTLGATKLAVSAASTQTAGTAFPVTLTAQNSDGSTDTTFTGAQAVTWGGSADTSSPSGQAAVTPASVSFTSGVGTANVTLYGAIASGSLTATIGSLTTGSASIAVGAGVAHSLAWSGASDSKATLSGSCFFTCAYTGSANSTFTANVALTDSYVNPVAAPSAVTVTASQGTGGGSFNGSAVVTISAGQSVSSAGGKSGGQISYTAPNGSGLPVALTATSSPSYAQVQATFGK